MGATGRWRTAVWVVFLAYDVFLLANLLGPQSVPSSNVGWLLDVARALGAPEQLLTARRFQFLVNAAVFAPVSVLGMLLWPRANWRDWTAYGFLASSAVEVIQRYLVPGRVPQFEDVVANTLGAAGGGILFSLLMRARDLAHGGRPRGQKGPKPPVDSAGD